jgi:hypothetical protein
MPEHVTEEELRTVDRELSQLLRVEPSPEFAATVRARIAIEAAPRSGWRIWAFASAAAAAAIVFTALALTRTAPASSPASAARADIHLSRVPQPPMVKKATSAPVVRTVRRRPVSDPANGQRSEPEVLFDPALASAVRRLAAEQPALPEVPPEPSLEPVVVEPLKVSDIADLGGVRLQADK